MYFALLPIYFDEQNIDDMVLAAALRASKT